jgi:uracil-DNA glycosylase family 4
VLSLMSLADVHQRIITCDACERLRSYCSRIAVEKKAAYRQETYWGRPVPGFGDPRARLFILGLAPAAHGANRTGRVFTGDGVGGSGDFLMAALHAAGFANLATSRAVDDGLVLRDAYISAAVRCAPPDNKPTPREIAACQTHLVAELAEMPDVLVIVALGRIAFDACWRVLALRGVSPKPRPAFAHHAVCAEPRAPIVIGSYHPSRQNTNTRKLTSAMLREVFADARRRIRASTGGR